MFKSKKNSHSRESGNPYNLEASLLNIHGSPTALLTDRYAHGCDALGDDYIESEKFARCVQQFAPFEDDAIIAIGVSGGPDSMALLLLLNEWAAENSSSVVALIVDHGLRTESGVEAAQVATWCKQRHIAHHILPWQGAKPKSGVMNAARSARYAILEQWCRDNHVLHLAVAHHADDQAETILMRFAKGSGIDGLAGMKAETFSKSIRILRPLLAFSKAQLVATCNASGQTFFVDASNNNEKYTRARLRNVVPLLQAEGFSTERLIDLGERASSAQQELQIQTFQALALCASFDEASVQLDWARVQNCSAEIQTRIFYHVLQHVGGLNRPPKRQQILHLLQHLNGQKFARRTLQNCMIMLKGGKITFSLENQAAKAA